MRSVQDPLGKYVDEANINFEIFGNGTDALKEDLMFGLRYQVYCIEREFLPASDYPNRLERDEYDPYSTYVSATDDDELMLGSMRMVRVSEGMLLPFQQHCTRFFPDKSLPPMHECAEISRVIVSKASRRRAWSAAPESAPTPASIELAPTRITSVRQREAPGGTPLSVTLGMFRAMYRHTKLSRVGYWYIAVEPALARLLRKLNFLFEAVGEEQDYYGPVTPYILPVAQFETDLLRNDPAMYEWFQAGLTEKAPAAAVSALIGHAPPAAGRVRVANGAQGPLRRLIQTPISNCASPM